jgi:hypothetical protein
MDEISFGVLLKNISIIVGILGTLAGIDLVLGARTITSLNKILDRSTDVIDKTISSVRSKKLFGFMVLFLSLIILLLGTKFRV